MSTTLNDSSRREFLGLLASLPLVPASTLLPRRPVPRPCERTTASAGYARDLGRTNFNAENAQTRRPPPSSTFDLPSSAEALARPFPIAGFQYHEGHLALPELAPGTALTLQPQPDNPHDPFAVAILHGSLMLGYVPRFCNRYLSQLLQGDVPLTCQVARISTDAPPWDAIAVRVTLTQPLTREVAPPASFANQLLAA